MPTFNIDQLYNYFTQVTGVSTDTRAVARGNLFFALKGGNFNGNEFALEAIAKGAGWAVVDEEKYANHEQCILVPNALEALQELAKYYRQQFDIPVLAVTGSNGKTTTKELCQAVLSQGMKAYSTKGNFNNHIGVPLTLLAMPADTEIAIVELGDNHIGEVAELCKIAQPTHGLVTNIGKDHIEGFGSFEGNIRAKSEIFQYLREHGGIPLISSKDPLLQPMGRRFSQPIWYGQQGDFCYLELLEQKPFVQYQDEAGTAVATHLIGTYNFENIQTAYAVGRYFGLSPELIHRGIANYVPQNNRSQLVEQNGHLIILDAYNANPSSVEVALESLHSLSTELPKVAILGDMLELGSISEAEHQAIAQQADQLPIEPIFCGKRFLQAKLPHQKGFETREALENHLKENPLKPSAILVKGSRGMALEKLLAVL